MHCRKGSVNGGGRAGLKSAWRGSASRPEAARHQTRRPQPPEENLWMLKNPDVVWMECFESVDALAYDEYEKVLTASTTVVKCLRMIGQGFGSTVRRDFLTW